MAYPMAQLEHGKMSNREKTIAHYEGAGWKQSHTATKRGVIFERYDDVELLILTTDANGNVHSLMRFDEFAVQNGVAFYAVQSMYEVLNAK